MRPPLLRTPMAGEGDDIARQFAELMNRMRAARAAVGHPTPGKLADMTSVSTSLISRAFTRTRIPHREVLLELAGVLGADGQEWARRWDELVEARRAHTDAARRCKIKDCPNKPRTHKMVLNARATQPAVRRPTGRTLLTEDAHGRLLGRGLRTAIPHEGVLPAALPAPARPA